MFLNRLLIDLTVTDLMSIVHMTQFELKLQKNLRFIGPGGRGWSMTSDTPRRGGRGVKKGKFLWTSFMDGPMLNAKACTYLKSQTKPYK